MDKHSVVDGYFGILLFCIEIHHLYYCILKLSFKMQEIFNKGNLELFGTIIDIEHSGIRERQKTTMHVCRQTPNQIMTGLGDLSGLSQP